MLQTPLQGAGCTCSIGPAGLTCSGGGAVPTGNSSSRISVAETASAMLSGRILAAAVAVMQLASFRLQQLPLSGGKLHSRHYQQLLDLPIPGTDGAVFHGDVYTTAYTYKGQHGCEYDGKFWPMYSTWNVTNMCGLYECLPNNNTQQRTQLIRRMHNCGPPAPRMMPYLCKYTRIPDPQQVFPLCCPRFFCLERYDPRRLMLPENSPSQGRETSPVVHLQQLQLSDDAAAEPSGQLPPIQTRVFRPASFGVFSRSKSLLGQLGGTAGGSSKFGFSLIDQLAGKAGTKARGRSLFAGGGRAAVSPPRQSVSIADILFN